jgi:hypothetical protein
MYELDPGIHIGSTWFSSENRVWQQVCIRIVIVSSLNIHVYYNYGLTYTSMYTYMMVYELKYLYTILNIKLDSICKITVDTTNYPSNF